MRHHAPMRRPNLPLPLPLPLALVLVSTTVGLGCSAPAPVPPADTTGTTGATGAEILWDTRGVPHVFAEDLESLHRAAGRAQAKAHANLVLGLYGTARGQAAELWGEEHLESDRWVRTVGIPSRAERWWDEQSDEARTALEAFAAGFNAWADAHPDAIEPEQARVLPVRPTDVLAHSQNAIQFTFMAHPARIGALRAAWLRSRSERTAERGDAAESRGPAGAMPLDSPAGEVVAGSNAWAVAPSRSASGHALLLANPHLPWGGVFTWFEQHLVAPGLDVSGAGLVGTPFLGIGFNDRLGWTHTVNTLDAVDVYELRLADGGLDAGYLFDGEVRPFEVVEETIRVREDDGTFREETLVVRSSVHGPVVGADATGALALRVAGLDASGLYDQYAAMARARNLAEFEEASARLQMPMFTTMYADRDGHVLHLFGGRIPVRPEDGRDWSGLVPGDVSETLWTTTRTYAELPRVVDPPSGWLQNANDPPWTTTFPRALDPAAFPATTAPREMGFRAQQSAQLLAEVASWTLEEMIAAKHSTEMELAVRLLDDLGEAVAAHGDERARRGMEILSAWNARADAESRGAVLFATFAEGLSNDGSGWSAVGWDPERPTSTPDGFADPAAAARRLAEAVEETETAHGAADVAWGEVHRLRLGDVDLPASGGPGRLGIFRVLGFAPVAGEATRRAVQGDSYVAAIEFGDPVRAFSLVGYGNSSQETEPEQLRAMANQELRPVWRTREEIERNLREREAGF